MFYRKPVTLSSGPSSGAGTIRTPSGMGGCTLEWDCTDWSECSPDGIQIRLCAKAGTCPNYFRRPEAVRECEYVPTCSDEIQNQGEEGVDCGGSCQACITCSDGIQNQNEEGIDCGGPCAECIVEEAIEEEPVPLAMPSIFMIILVLGIFITYSVTRKGVETELLSEASKPPTLPTKSGLTADEDRLIDFIGRCTKEGYSPKEIKQMLINKGWPEDYVNEFIDMYFGRK